MSLAFLYGGQVGKNAGGAGRARRPTIAGAIAAPPTAQVLNPVAPVTTSVLGPSETINTPSGRVYRFETETGDVVRFEVLDVGDRTSGIEFTVNGYYNKGVGNVVSSAQANAITMRLIRHLREDVKTRPDGWRYVGSAATGDGSGNGRAQAYQAIGMSRPVRAEAGGEQYGIVRNGKLIPDNNTLRATEGMFRFADYNESWAQQRLFNRMLR